MAMVNEAIEEKNEYDLPDWFIDKYRRGFFPGSLSLLSRYHNWKNITTKLRLTLKLNFFMLCTKY